MLLWIIFALLTAIVLAILFLPLGNRKAAVGQPQAAAADIAVYKDQLTEIDADLERGLIGQTEAEAARTEVSRRLLAQAEQPNGQSVAAPADGLGRSRLARYLAAGSVPVLALSLYLYAGSPNLPAQPYSERVAAPSPTARLDVLVARAEEQLRRNPKDGMGWDVLAPVYLRQRRFSQAAEAYARALDILGESPKRLIGLAESRLALNNGVVNEAIRTLFKRVLELQPEHAEAQYWLIKAKEQDGQLRAAAAGYRAMLDKASPQAPWRGMVAGQLRNIENRLGIAPSTGDAKTAANGGASATPGRGPTAADIAAAQKMTVQDRMQMINQMVGRLAERLKTNGNDLPGWQKLVRAYAVLGKSQEAKSALATARKQFAGDGKALAVLDQLAKQFKLGT